MLNPAIADPQEGVRALIFMDLLRSLITEATTETISRVDLLVLIDCLMSDREIFTPEALELFAAIDAAPLKTETV